MLTIEKGQRQKGEGDNLQHTPNVFRGDDHKEDGHDKAAASYKE
jgi:hypothetical protein